MDASNKGQHNMQDADADYNSSEYTHSNLDPTVESNDQPTSSSTQHQGQAQDASQSEPSAVDHSHAMEAVMQLAQAASQQQYDSEQHQQHGHLENPDVHHESLPVNNAEDNTGGKRGEKRRSSQSGSTSGTGAGGRRGSKAARQEEEQDLSSAAAAAASGDNSLPFPDSWSEGNIPAEIQKAYQQHLAQAQANLAQQHQSPPSTSASPSHEDQSQSGSGFKPTRQLSTSKRAAQNRAAQRAFRERRDKYVKVLESKATRLETAIRIATECKRRYVEALHTIDGLRQDNHTLRVALAALSGSGGNAGPGPVMKADDLANELPEIPLLTTQEEEEVLGAVGGQAVSGASGSASGLGASGGQSLDSLSAVAAAAAAAQGDASTVGAEVGKETQTQQQQGGEGGEEVSIPPATTSAGEGKGVPAPASASAGESANASGVSLPPVPSTTSSSTGTASAQ